MGHWLTMRPREGKTYYDRWWGSPTDPRAGRPAASVRQSRRDRTPSVWRRGIGRVVAGARA